MTPDTLAIILGGGQGSRLFPLTATRSKPAVPIGAKYRLIDVPVSGCLHAGIRRIFVLTQFNSASLNRHIGSTYQLDIFSGGFVEILAAEQTPDNPHWYQGTADAVRRSTSHFRSYPHDRIIILSGDQLYTMNYRILLDFHLERGADITVAVTPVIADDAPGFGILRTNETQRITEFYEKPRLADLEGKESPVSADLEEAGRIYLASMGIYVFEAHVLYDVLDARPDDHDFGKAVIPNVLNELNVFAYPFKGYWNDIGTVRSFFETNIMLAQPHPAFNLYDPDFPLYTDALMLPPAKISRSRLENSLVGVGSVIVDSDISNSVIGLRSFIDRGSYLRRTVFMGADYFRWEESEARSSAQGPTYPGVGRNTRIENAIVDKNASIGNDCLITNEARVQEGEGPGYYIRDGIVVILKNAEIPDGTVI
ncbi:MAG: glucose-1-phosphate adenylyltransferase [Gemmatimonadota bacterium]|nr:glucose-1-phosphate adenylyltransferase [Gemmatimonadota bacterium]